MRKWLLPFGSLTAIAIGVLVALAVAGVFDSDDASGDRAPSEGEASGNSAAICLEGAEDCDDMIEDGAEGACLEGEPDCADIPGTSQMCIEGAEDCVDTLEEPLPPPDEGDYGDVDTGSNCTDGDDCLDLPAHPDQPTSSSSQDGHGPQNRAEELAVDAAMAALQEMSGSSGPVAAEVSAIEPVEWPNSCLGVEQEAAACAEVITSGYVIILSGASDWVFHTDTNGNAIPAPPAQ